MIRKRRNGLRVQVYAGRDPLTGRKRWVSRQVPGQTKRSYREAKKIDAELLEQVDRGQHRGSSSRTVAELIERWYSWRQQVRPISPVTLANYRGAIDRYILPNLGRAKVQQVDASTIDALYEHVRARGGKCRHCWQRVRRGIPPLRVGERYRPQPSADEAVHKLDCVNGWPLSASAVREVHSGWIAYNPVKQATPPSTGSAGVSPPDAQGVARLLEVARDEDPELGLFLRLAVVLGARRGELCGLKWRDVDLDTGEVFIAGGVVRVAGRRLIDKDTKTHAKRRVAIGSDTVELIRSYRLRQVQAALAVGASLPADAYVFSQKADGSKPASPDGVTHRFQQLVARLGVRARLHDLRTATSTPATSGSGSSSSTRASHEEGRHMPISPHRRT